MTMGYVVNTLHILEDEGARISGCRELGLGPPKLSLRRQLG